MSNKVRLKLLASGIALLLVQVWLIYVLIGLSGDGIGVSGQSGQQTPESANSEMITPLGTVDIQDVSKRYEQLKNEFDNIKNDEYTPENVYDLDTDYLDTLDMVDTPNLNSLGINSDIFCMPIDTYEKMMSADALKDMYVQMPEDYAIQTGDTLLLKIFTTVDGEQVHYLDNVYKYYIVGEPEWIPEVTGLDDVLTGKKSGDIVVLTGKVPSEKTGTILNDDGNLEEIDISGKDITFDITICSVLQLQASDPTDENAKDLAEQREIVGIKNLNDYGRYILRDYAYKTGANKLNGELLKLFKGDENTKFSDELNNHLNLVITQIRDKADDMDVYGPVYNEIQKAILYETYTELYDQLPDAYKYDYSNDESVVQMLNKLDSTEYDEAYIDIFKKNFQSDKDFEYYVKSSSVLIYLVDNTELKPVNSSEDISDDLSEDMSDDLSYEIQTPETQM